jgi:DNA (cytosine-5)-methyltransferase 1
MKLLDLFCGAGGAGEGYRLAGFTVAGVDIEHHDYKPGAFLQMHALDALSTLDLSKFDAIHASPPCQGYTTMTRQKAAQEKWPRLIAPLRELLKESGLPWVIENVVGAKREMRNPVLLHGGMFGLNVSRPRLFEASFPISATPAPAPANPVGVYGRRPDGRRLWTRADGSELRAAASNEEGQAAMGIDWMGWDDLREAIPPAYTHHIGSQLIQILTARRAA